MGTDAVTRVRVCGVPQIKESGKWGPGTLTFPHMSSYLGI